jgi:hypothetical protein
MAERSQPSPAPAHNTSSISSAMTSHTAHSKKRSTSSSHDSASARKSTYPHPPSPHATEGPPVRTSSSRSAQPFILKQNSTQTPSTNIFTLTLTTHSTMKT